MGASKQLSRGGTKNMGKYMFWGIQGEERNIGLQGYRTVGNIGFQGVKGGAKYRLTRVQAGGNKGFQGGQGQREI